MKYEYEMSQFEILTHTFTRIEAILKAAGVEWEEGKNVSFGKAGLYKDNDPVCGEKHNYHSMELSKTHGFCGGEAMGVITFDNVYNRYFKVERDSVHIETVWDMKGGKGSGREQLNNPNSSKFNIHGFCDAVVLAVKESVIHKAEATLGQLQSDIIYM